MANGESIMDKAINPKIQFHSASVLTLPISFPLSMLTFFRCLGRRACLREGWRSPGPPDVYDGSCVSVFQPVSLPPSAAGWFLSSSSAFLEMPADTFTLSQSPSIRTWWSQSGFILS